MILAGTIGATNTVLALCDATEECASLENRSTHE